VGVLAEAGDDVHGRRVASHRARQHVEVWQRGDDAQLRLAGPRHQRDTDQGGGEHGGARETGRDGPGASDYPP